MSFWALPCDDLDTTYLAKAASVTTGSGQPAVVSDSDRGSAKAITVNSFGKVAITFAATATPMVGGAFKIASLANALTLFSFLDAGTDQVRISVNTDGTLQAKRGTTAIGSPSTWSALTGAYYGIEVSVVIADSGGTVEVRIGGSATPVL